MKHFAILSIIALASCSTKFDLNGTWIAYGYTCQDNQIREEKIRISQNGIDVIAKKIEGDDCIKSGETSWEGTITGNTIKVFIYGINPQTLKKEKFAMEMNIISKDSIMLDLGNTNLEFKRDESDDNNY